MKKCTFMIIFVLLLTAFSSVSVLAATSGVSRVKDDAGLLSSSQASDLESRLQKASSKGNMDVIVITKDSIPETYAVQGNNAAEKYADDLYDNGGYSADGILLLVCRDSRDYAITTAGRARQVFTDSELAGIENKVVSYLRNNDWNSALFAFADEVASAKNFKFGMWAAIAAAVGALVGAIRSGSLKSELKSVHSQSEARNYIKQGSLKMNKKYDVKTYITVERTKIERANNNGTTTHVSSAGVEHGGTSGKF
ncbi:MAG: TPM domain-containing protein [Lachnospiraceae bacterium]|nr:TPM domain-containing protein [Lachnospiraceae bacterium]